MTTVTWKTPEVEILSNSTAVSIAHVQKLFNGGVLSRRA